jgi:hypothetical protein
MRRLFLVLACFAAAFVTLDMLAPEISFATNFNVPGLKLFYLVPLVAGLGVYIVLVRVRNWKNWKETILAHAILLIFLFLLQQAPRWYLDSKIDCITLRPAAFQNQNWNDLKRSLDFKILTRSDSAGFHVCFEKVPGRRESLEKILAKKN